MSERDKRTNGNPGVLYLIIGSKVTTMQHGESQIGNCQTPDLTNVKPLIKKSREALYLGCRSVRRLVVRHAGDSSHVTLTFEDARFQFQ